MEEEKVTSTKAGTRFSRAFVIVSGVAIAATTSTQADAGTRKDGCPYYPSAVACRGEQPTATEAHQSASYYRSKRSNSHHAKK
jgi:hypothetical protein